MSAANSATHYGSVTKSFHWLTALLILSLIPMGWYAERLPYETDVELARKAWFFSLHKTLGVATFFVASARILWAATQTKPALLHADRRVESFAAEAVHWTLYGALVVVPLSGWISHAAALGFAPIWWPFGQGLPLIPKSMQIEHIFSDIHWIATKVLIAALLAHIAGALKHHIIDQDATLRRMLPGRPAMPDLPKIRHSLRPAVAALVLWGGVLAAGVLMSSGSEVAGEVEKLEQAASEWTVEEGKVEITVLQFGAEVTGSFADWTSAITFDEDNPEMTVGAVTTTIAIPSLTLGSVTQQAMGADFFDAATFPTAVFQADLNRGVDGYEAVGTLQIRDSILPLVMPFSLSVTDDTAQMSAKITLDRRDFGIGDNMTDTSSLGFNVVVDITLSVTRSTDS